MTTITSTRYDKHAMWCRSNKERIIDRLFVILRVSSELYKIKQEAIEKIFVVRVLFI
jgi:hypothetical protein